MVSKDDFLSASERVKGLSRRPSNDELLSLYALYKQATVGDVQGKKPSAFDLKGRKKYEAWADVSGTASEDAMEKYVALVQRLEASDR